jgi:hypothetical protein
MDYKNVSHSFLLTRRGLVVGPHVQWPLHIRSPFQHLDNLKLKICIGMDYKPLMQSPSVAQLYDILPTSERNQRLKGSTI